MINFKNKKILITGATGGIGMYLVKKFLSLDGNVIATGTNEKKLENLEKPIFYDTSSSINLPIIPQTKNPTNVGLIILYPVLLSV